MSNRATVIENRMRGYLEEHRFAGAAVLVRKEGKEEFHACLGKSDIEKNLPVSKKTIFCLASMTKPVIATAAMILADQGKWKIDDPVEKYIPAFKNQKAANKMVGFTDIYEADPKNPMMPKYHPEKLEDIRLVPLVRPVTIRDILRHCSGMGQGPFSSQIYQQKSAKGQTLEERVNIIGEIPLDFQPGTFAGYSAVVAFDVLGRLIEIVSEEDLDTFIRKYICEPLAIQDMGYRLTKEQLERTARIYESNDEGLTDVTETDELWEMVNPLPGGFFSGSAGMFGSLEAYDRFAQMLANRGELDGVRVLKPETVMRMSQSSTEYCLEMSTGIAWGLGMIVHVDPERSGRKVSRGTFGWSGAYGTHFFIDPLRKISAVMMMSVSNIGGADSDIARQFENDVSDNQ